MVALIFLRILRTGAAAEFPSVAGISPISTDPKLDREREARQRHDDPQHGDREVADKSLPGTGGASSRIAAPSAPPAGSVVRLLAVLFEHST
jgi:hypothetical protein